MGKLSTPMLSFNGAASGAHLGAQHAPISTRKRKKVLR
jgi:hypothetical protein